MAYQIDYAYTCHTGKVRTNNEDNFWCCGVRLPVHNQGVDGILAGHTQHWQLPMLAVLTAWAEKATVKWQLLQLWKRWEASMKKTKRP